MITSKTELENASPKTKRVIRYEFELEHVAQDAIFESTSTRQFRAAVTSRVVGDPHYAMLPKYRRVAIDAYIRGALDYAARTVGQPMSEPPDVVKPKRASVPPKLGAAFAGPLHSFPNVWSAPLGAAARDELGISGK